MNEQDFLEYLKDPLKGAACASEREVEQLFGHQIVRTMLRSKIKDQYMLSIYADNADILEDIYPRVINLIEARLPSKSSVTTHEIVKIFRLHSRGDPERWVREYFISYNWQT